MYAIQRKLTSAIAALSVAGIGVTVAAATAAAQSPEQLQQTVERELRRDRALRRLDVSVAGDEVTLTGSVRNFWRRAKRCAARSRSAASAPWPARSACRSKRTWSGWSKR